MWEESMYVCEYEEFLPVMCSFYNVCVWINIYVCVCELVDVMYESVGVLGVYPSCSVVGISPLIQFHLRGSLS